MPGTRIIPPRIRRGDKVAVVAPSGPVPAERLRSGLALLAPHFALAVADDIARAEGYLAGGDARRAEELNACLRDPDIRGLWVARGGYGISRILPLLDGDALRADPIPIVGFSDATALLAWAYAEGISGVHGPVVAQLAELPAKDVQWAVELLMSPRTGVYCEELRAPSPASPPVAGRLLGGNLSLLAHLVGSPYFPPLSSAILVLEDVGERPYAIDRYLTQLERSGALGEVAAALAGDFTRCEEARIVGSPAALAVVKERLDRLGVSLWEGAPSGHGRRNRAWPFGGRAELEGARVRLVDSAVS